MRPTGRLHLGHYHGVLKNWIRLQHEYECFFFVADWHALTTHYEAPYDIEQYTFDTVVDWLAAGVSPGSATVFVQSKVPEHAELHLLLSMITPVSWLERVPSYKDQQAKLNDRDLSTYGFLGYPVLMSADVLSYRAGNVPVGADQVAHVEVTREIARRFNHIYGREPQFEQHAEAAVKKMGKKAGRLYSELRKAYLTSGDVDALQKARALLADQQNLSIGDRERLFGYLEGGGRIILPEPRVLLTESVQGAGTRRREDVEIVREHDPDARRARRDRAEDQDDEDRPGAGTAQRPGYARTVSGVRAARDLLESGDARVGGAGLPYRRDRLSRVQRSVDRRDRGRAGADPRTCAAIRRDKDMVQSILIEGSEKARDVARETLEVVRAAIGISHR